VVFLEGYTRPMVRVSDYLELIDESTYGKDRVRPDVSTLPRRSDERRDGAAATATAPTRPTPQEVPIVPRTVTPSADA